MGQKEIVLLIGIMLQLEFFAVKDSIAEMPEPVAQVYAAGGTVIKGLVEGKVPVAKNKKVMVFLFQKAVGEDHMLLFVSALKGDNKLL